MNRIISTIESINKKIAGLAGWSSFLLVLLVCVDVLLRYMFQWSRVWMMELELYLFVLIFLLGAAYAFQEDQHVRVDVFYSNMTMKNKAWVDLAGGILFLIPWTIVIMYISQRYFIKSWSINEHSAQPGGLPFLFIKKGLIFVGFFFLFLQGIVSVYKSIKTIQGKH